MHDELVIRPATADDMGAIAALWQELGWLAWLRAKDPAQVEAAMARRLGEAQEAGGHLVLVAESREGRVLGYAAMHFLPYLMLPGPEAYVSELFVTAAARGQGVGGRLLRHLEELARERGCARLMLITGKNRESYARGFYKKHGWQERPHIANFVLSLKEY